MMKILIPTPVFPEKKSIRINYINKILSELRKTESVEILWFVYLPDKFSSYSLNKNKIFDIHDFYDGVNVLQKLQPDCVMVGSHYDPIQHSLSLASKNLKIPLISFFYFDYKTESADSFSKGNQLIQYARMISSKTMPSDTKKEGKLFRRFKFILYKFAFLRNTNQTLKIPQPSSFMFFIKNLTNYLVWKKIPINTLPDLFLLPQSSWIEPLLKLGIKEDNLSVTGNPLWDDFVFQSINHQNRNKKSKISILIVTDPLLQHGIWSLNKFSSFINLLLSDLLKEPNFSISLKIHPSSENKQFYEKILLNYNQHIPIFQNESIWKIIDNYDIIVSFGFSTIHSEIALSGEKMILLDFDFNFPYLDFVNEAITFGNIKICNDINFLNKLIPTFVNTKLNINEFQKQIKTQFNLTGKSSKLCSDTIINLVNNQNN